MPVTTNVEKKKAPSIRDFLKYGASSNPVYSANYGVRDANSRAPSSFTQTVTINGKTMPYAEAVASGFYTPPKSAKEKGIEAMEEAKQKQEAGKLSALSYYDTAMKNIQELNKNSLGLYKNVSENIEAMNPDLITSEDQRRMLANRKANLSASGQNLTGMFKDSDSGVQTGRRLGIARSVASESAMLPIDTELEVKGLNRTSALNLLDRKTNLAGNMTNTNQSLANAYLSTASGKAGVETAYQYDGGAEYLNQLGEATGKGTGTPSSTKVSMRPKDSSTSSLKETTSNFRRPTTSVKLPSVSSFFPSSAPAWSNLNLTSQSSFKRRR